MRVFMKIFGLLIALGAVVSCSKPAFKPAESGPAVRVQALTVSTADQAAHYVYSGTLQGEKSARLSTKVMGQIVTLAVEAGDRVRAGQTLVKVRSEDLAAKRAQVQANLLEAQAAFKNVEINYNRMKELLAKKSATQKEFDDVEMAYNMAQARVNAVREMETEIRDILDYSEIKAPFDGYIVQKMAQQGDMATPGMPLLIIEDQSRWQVVCQAPESEVALVTVGDSVKVLLAGLPDAVLAGSVAQVNAGGNPASRQFDVKIRLAPTTTTGLKSGLSATVTLKKGARQTVTIPKTWLIVRGQLTGVFTVNGQQQAALRWIRVGHEEGDLVEVLSGLIAGEQIIRAEAGSLRDGQKVEVQQ